MNFNQNTIQTIYERMRTDSQAVLPSLNSGLRESLHASLLKAFAGSSSEKFRELNILIDLIFIDTSTGDYLEAWGSYKSITRNPATQAQGYITATGLAGTFVPLGTNFSTDDGVQYQTLNNETVSNQNLSVSTITRIANTATVTTASDHNLASGVEVTISGAVETEYNGTFLISVNGSDTFTYTVSGSPTTPATGTINANFTTVSLEVQSINTGQDTNQLSGVSLIVDSGVPGLDDTAYVQFGELGGGTALESDDDLRIRILEAYQNPIALFNVAQIVAQAKLVSGVTRVFVQETTPKPGQVTVYFTRDNDTNIIPSLSEVEAVKNSLLLIKPAFIQDADVFVLAPTPVSTDFSFFSITPNTPTMQAAIQSNLEEFFKTKTQIGEDVEEDDYRCAINDTIDTETGDVLDTYTLTTPTGDIAVGIGELATLGVVNF